MDNASMQHEIPCRGDQTGRPYIRRLMCTANENCQLNRWMNYKNIVIYTGM